MGDHDIIDIVVYLILLGIVILTPVIISLDAFHPYVTVKETIFLFLICIAIIVWVAKIIFTGKIYFIKSNTSLAVTIYMAYSILSYLISDFSDRIYLLNLLGAIIFYFLLTNFVTDKRKIKGIIISWMIALVPCIIYGTMQYFGRDYTGFIGYFGAREIGLRVFSFFGNPNIYAVFLTMSIPVMIGYFLAIKNRIIKSAVGILIIGATVNLLFTQTRGGWIGLFGGMTVFVLLSLLMRYRNEISKKNLIKTIKRPITIIVLIVLLIIISGGIIGLVNYYNSNKKSIGEST